MNHHGGVRRRRPVGAVDQRGAAEGDGAILGEGQKSTDGREGGAEEGGAGQTGQDHGSSGVGVYSDSPVAPGNLTNPDPAPSCDSRRPAQS